MTDAYDVVIVGAGPAGLSAALALGRACRRVLVCDSGPRRNERAHAMQNFVTRDGTKPDEFRRIAREQMAQYTNVEFLDSLVTHIAPRADGFLITTAVSTVETRRVLLCTGVTDEPLGIEGADVLWGRSIFQCPYCHGWERRNQRWGYLATSAEALDFVLLLQHWTPHVTLYTQGEFELSGERAVQLTARGVVIETQPIVALLSRDAGDEPMLTSVRFTDGSEVGCDALFTHPKQHASALVRALGVAFDDSGFIAVDPMTRQTSVPGIYAAGDATTRQQAAIIAAASGMHAAAAINHGLAL